jgi:hypothetical protein
MKADIDRNGCLTVSAENGVEAYALQKWDVEAAGSHGVLAIDTESFINTCGAGQGPRGKEA